jgi:hypothetical protein
MQSGYQHLSMARVLVHGPCAGGIAGGLRNGYRVFAVRWMNSLAKSPVPEQRKLRNESMAENLMKGL